MTVQRQEAVILTVWQIFQPTRSQRSHRDPKIYMPPDGFGDRTGECGRRRQEKDAGEEEM